MKRTSIKKRILSVFLTISIILSGISGFSIISSADGADTRITDPHTMDNWKRYYGSEALSTAMAGGVWSDKSVFTDTSAFPAGLGLEMKDAQNNFLVALSAIASNKSIVGYSNIPTDTMLVLDLSNSMTADNMRAMISATNSAIKKLQDTNYNNRVGVVLYSGNTQVSASGTSTATVILGLDRYVHSESTYLTYSGGAVRVNSNVLTESGTAVPTSSKSKGGGTYIQNGIYKALGEMLAVPKADTVITEGIQAGAKRMPIIVLMSDGAPTAATTSYNNVGRSNHGDGTSTNDNTVFLTQLTNSYAKARVEDHYENKALFYTLGLGVSNDTRAMAVLDPARSSNSILSKWSSFLGLESGNTLSLSNTLTVKRDMTVTADYQYYTNEAFTASNASDLVAAFESIVQQIIIQSLYYPTFIENGNTELDGYLKFVDVIGEYMDVTDIKGVIIGDKLFTGAMLASNFVQGGGELGTVDNPKALGDEFIHAVKERLGIENSEDARDLVKLAFEYGQLAYTSDKDFSNYIGWYANDNGDYLGFWREGHSADDAPAQATYINKSYGLLGAVQDGIKKTDMMYASIQVHTNIATGNVTLIWAIPAALIPVISYNVSFEGSSLENASNIKVNITDQTPIRLVYEVGLREDITPFNISEKVSDDYKYKNSDGTYTFYTNKWDVDMFNRGSKYSEQVNTVSYFDPSMDNERFYFIKNEPVYAKSGSVYTEYSGGTLESGTYYRLHQVFTITDTETGAAEYSEHYDEIYGEALENAVRNSDNTWYIPKGTVLPSVRLNSTEKTENRTGTLGYSGYPTVELAYTENEVDHYYVDAVLGNNGKITVTPAQGIKLSKVLDTAIPGANDSFRFNITGSDTQDNSSYRIVFIDEYGAQSEGFVSFTSGKASVTLRPGQTIYITGLPTGAEYNISEQMHSVYSPTSVNGISAKDIDITIEEYVISNAAFVNSPKGEGSLIISKNVEHELGSDWNSHKDKLFTFKVDLGAENASKSFSITLAAGTDLITADEDGGFTITLKDGESAKIDGITEDTEVTVTEIDIPDGFTPEAESIKAVISSVENAIVPFNNNYTPAKVYPVNITLEGDKTLVGRDWLDTDSFSFTLERLDGAVWKVIDTQSVSSLDRSFSFTDALSNEQFTKAGIYDFRVAEVKGSIGGIIYDTVFRYFTIEVTDTDADGKLEIGKAAGGTDVTVSNDNNIWALDVGFGNRYAPRGDAHITIDITKHIENSTSTDIPRSGFSFGLYNQGDLVAESAPTDENGKAYIGMTFLASDAGKKFVYTLREILPEEHIPGMIYSGEIYTVTVDVIDNLDETVSALVHNESAQASGSTFAAEFTNKYLPEEIDVTVNGSKILHGREMAAGEFEFELYEIIGGAEVFKGKATNNEAGYFAFETLVFTTTGTHFYVVKEAAGNAASVTYDNSIFRLNVTITDENGVLVESVEKTDENGEAVDHIRFENVYTPAPASISVKGQKTLSGRELREGEFTFELYEASESFTPAFSPLRVAVNGQDGSFAFDPIVYTEAGIWYYTVIESASDPQGGITYDRRTYHVTVTVTDDGKGTLSASAIYADHSNRESSILFENRYAPTPASLVIDGEKILVGRELSFGEFKFDIYEATGDAGAYKPTGRAVKSAENNENGSFVFGALRFEAVGVYKYVIVEDASSALERVTYDSSVYELTVEVTDNGTGALTTAHTLTKQAADGAVAAADVSVAFTNIYTPRPSDAVLDVSVKKTVRSIGSKSIGPGGFRFMLKSLDTQAVEQVNTDEDGNAKFTLTYSEEDIGHTFSYEITETGGGQKNVTYSDRVYTLTVSVGFDSDTNRIVLNKALDGQEVNEVVTAFENIYEEYLPYTTTVIEGRKYLIGRDLKAGEFEFELFPADADFNITGEAVDSARNDADGRIVFGAIPFTGEATVNYIIREKSDPSLGGVIYDSSDIRASIKVTDDGKGILTALVRYYDEQGNGSALEFINYYVPSPTELTLSGSKELSGREMTAEEFGFAIFEAEGEEGAYTATRTVQKSSAKNNADGSFTFETLYFDTAGVYKFIIIEDASAALPRITYDSTVYELTVTVTDDGNGALSHEYRIRDQKNTEADAEIAFTNVYTPAPDSITFDIDILKTVKGINGSMSPEGFEFRLKDEKTGAETYVKTDANGKARFTLTYAETDIGAEYTYTVNEVKGNVKGVTYSDAVYTVKVKLSLGENNTIAAEASVNEIKDENVVCEFENIYVFETPDTGDGEQLTAWLSVLFVSATALFTLVIGKKKTKA